MKILHLILVSTPPNAIVYSSSDLRLVEMMKPGILNLDEIMFPQTCLNLFYDFLLQDFLST